MILKCFKFNADYFITQLIISYYKLAAQADECWFLNIDVSLYFDEHFIINKKGNLF